MNETQTVKLIKVYRYGRLSRYETIKPLIHARMLSLGNYIDRVFTDQHFMPN